jgi:hypothetical protein
VKRILQAGATPVNVVQRRSWTVQEIQSGGRLVRMPIALSENVGKRSVRM